MLGFVIYRILQAIPVLLAVGLIAFAMFTFLGDPVTAMLGQTATTAERQAVTHRLGLDQPFYDQFVRFLWAVLHGDLGISYRLARPVAGLLVERLPATVELAMAASLLALTIGIPAGVYTGLRPTAVISRLLLTLGLIGVSVPTFLLGILLILVFSVVLHWLPSFGRGGVVRIGWWSTGLLTAAGLRALVLPSVTLAAFQLTLIMRLVRAEMLEVLRADYIRFARARGLTDRAINFGHALRNTLVPVVTIAGLQFGMVIAFSIVTETVFQWPGLGLLLVQSIAVADVPVMSAYLLLVAVLFVCINLAVDLLYYAIDPRLRSERRVVLPGRR